MLYQIFIKMVPLIGYAPVADHYQSLVSTFVGSIASLEVKGDGKVVYRPEEALYQLNFSTSTEVDSIQWQTAGNVKIHTEN